MSYKMNIYVSPYDATTKTKTIGQQIFFINVLNGAKEATKTPDKVPYKIDGEFNSEAVCLLNYQKGDGYQEEQGFSPMKSSETSLSSIFRQEIDEDGNELTRFYPVDTQISNFTMRDFNISNNRRYRYVLYPLDQSAESTTLLKSTADLDKIHWQGWSITELHPIDSTNKKFTAEPKDVWIFNLNVETGEQTQNISRSEQQTLGRFNRYSQGKLNYVSGSVSCLLGRDVLPASYVINKNKNGSIYYKNEGGYQEVLPYGGPLTSNERVDMLLAWRNVVMSSNPKLLKDRAGQSFIVTLNSATNKPINAVGMQPNTISFTWTQIGSTEDVQIIDDNIR